MILEHPVFGNYWITAKDLSQFQWKTAHAPKKELPKDFL